MPSRSTSRARARPSHLFEASPGNVFRIHLQSPLQPPDSSRRKPRECVRDPAPGSSPASRCSSRTASIMPSNFTSRANSSSSNLFEAGFEHALRSSSRTHASLSNPFQDSHNNAFQIPFQLPESLQSQPRECLTDQAPEPVPGLLESLRNQPPNFIEIQVQTPFQLIESLSKGRHGVWLRISYAFSRLASKRFERLEQAAEADCDNIGRTIRQCGSRNEASTECDKTHAEPSPGPFPGPDFARSSIGCTCFEESRNSCALISITYPVGPDFRDSCAKPWFFTHETPLKESRNVPGQSKHVSALFVNLYMFGAFKRDARSPGNSCPSHPMSRIGNVCVPKMKGPSQCPKHSCAEFTLRSLPFRPMPCAATHKSIVVPYAGQRSGRC